MDELLGMRSDGMLGVDLSCHNFEALRNAQLLRAYAELHTLVHRQAAVQHLVPDSRDAHVQLAHFFSPQS